MLGAWSQTHIDEDELVDLAEDWATETLVDPDVLNAPILKSPVVE